MCPSKRAWTSLYQSSQRLRPPEAYTEDRQPSVPAATPRFKPPTTVDKGRSLGNFEALRQCSLRGRVRPRQKNAPWNPTGRRTMSGDMHLDLQSRVNEILESDSNEEWKDLRLIIKISNHDS